MKGLQKALLCGGLVAMGATAIMAPYRYVGHWAIAPLFFNDTRANYVTGGTLHAPMWAPPSRADVVTATMHKPYDGPHAVQMKSGDYVEDGEVTLDAGKLLLWWAAIAAVTIVLGVVAA